MTLPPLRALAAIGALTFALGAFAQPLKPAPKPATGTGGKTTTAPKPGAPAKAVSQNPGQTIVTVGSVSIKKGRIDTLASLMARARGADFAALPPAQAMMLRRMVVTNLIGQELVELEAKAKGITATPAEIDSGVRALKSQFPDAATWQRALKQSGDTEAEVRAKVARQLRSDKVLGANIDQPTSPSDAELRAFWEKNKKEFPVHDSLRALQILLKADAKVTGEAAAEKQRRLEVLRRDLAADSAEAPVLLRNFMSEAARVGEGPEARIGGDLERFHPADFHPDFRSKVADLRVGQMSPVFRTPLGFHLVLLIEKYDGKFDSYRLQSLQNVMARKNMQLGLDMRDFLKKLASRHQVKFLAPDYRDTSESGIY